MHGFELMEQIFERTAGMWRPGPSAIYPTLAWLEDKGYVEKLPTEARGGESPTALPNHGEGKRSAERL